MKKHTGLRAIAMMLVLLTMATLVSSSYADGETFVTIRNGRDTAVIISMMSHNLSKDQKCYSVSLYAEGLNQSNNAGAAGFGFGNSSPFNGFNQPGNAGASLFGNTLPFDIVIAWDRNGYTAVIGNQTPSIGSFVNVRFDSKDDTPMEEPRYIIITPKGAAPSDRWYYVISKEKFYRASEIPEEIP